MRLIDADALIDALGGWDWQELYLPVHFKDFIIDEAPTIDAVPVVRCKDCEYRKVFEFHHNGIEYFTKECIRGNKGVIESCGDGGYCSLAERKEKRNETD